jgi:hypothetical protein
MDAEIQAEARGYHAGPKEPRIEHLLPFDPRKSGLTAAAAHLQA